MIMMSTIRAISVWGGASISSGLNRAEIDPLFANSSQFIFDLIAESPAIDAGIHVGYSYDFLGNPVLKNSCPDLGAYVLQEG